MVTLFLTSTAAALNRVEKQIVFQSYVGQKNRFTNMLYNDQARTTAGRAWVDQMKKSGANSLAYVVETVDFQSAVVFVLATLENDTAVSLRIEVVNEKPGTAGSVTGCDLADKMVMDAVDRYTRCYLNPKIYDREDRSAETTTIGELGDRIKTSTEYLIATVGISAEVAVTAFGLSPDLQTMRQHIRMLKDVHQRQNFAPLLLRAHGYPVDLRETYLWKPAAEIPPDEDTLKVVASRDYLKKKKWVFVDSNHRCEKLTTPALVPPARLKSCLTTRVEHDSVRELITALERSGARWDSQRAVWK